MAHLTAKVAGKCSLPYAQEKEESQILVSTRDACQCNLESGLQDEGADVVRQTAGNMCRDSWKSSFQPHFSLGLEKALGLSIDLSKVLAILGDLGNVSFSRASLLYHFDILYVS